MLFLKVSRSALVSCIRNRALSTTNLNWTANKTVQEKVHPYTKIHINCAYNLKIVPYDLLGCPDSNILKATVKQGGNVDSLAVKITDKIVTITSDPNAGGSECILEVPIKADLQIRNDGSTSIANLYSDEIEVVGTGNIETRSLRSTNINLCSTAGNIACQGITLAENVTATTSGKGNIFLDKLQGGSVNAITEAGSISVNASYSNRSTFQTQNGDLELKSIHKDCTVRSNGGKNFVMKGFYGTLNADVASENVTLQLSEMVGKSNIKATGTQLLHLNLAETVYETSSIDVRSSNLTLDSSMDDKEHRREGSSATLGKADAENTLHVETNGSVVLRKMSWTDSFSFSEGFYGTLNADVASENVTLQLSEMVGKSNIKATGTQLLHLNLAETVYETSSIDVRSSNLTLDSSMDDKEHRREGSSATLGKADAENTLHVETNGSVVLRKMSWADSFSFSGMSQMEQQ
uniref:Adhesin domain-containing protein n=1 Tax=Anopheles christyi TaxID=43041 RepID=A0A182K653_9DIPT